MKIFYAKKADTAINTAVARVSGRVSYFTYDFLKSLKMAVNSCFLARKMQKIMLQLIEKQFCFVEVRNGTFQKHTVDR